jgi:hypothetical protein
MKDTFGYSSPLDELVLDITLVTSSSLDELLVPERMSRVDLEVCGCTN